MTVYQSFAFIVPQVLKMQHTFLCALQGQIHDSQVGHHRHTSGLAGQSVSLNSLYSDVWVMVIHSTDCCSCLVCLFLFLINGKLIKVHACVVGIFSACIYIF